MQNRLIGDIHYSLRADTRSARQNNIIAHFTAGQKATQKSALCYSENKAKPAFLQKPNR